MVFKYFASSLFQISKVLTGLPLKSPLKNKYNLLSTILKVSGFIENFESFSATPQAQYLAHSGKYFFGFALNALALAFDRN